MADYPDATYVGRVDYGHPSYRGAVVFRRPMGLYYVERADGTQVGPLPAGVAHRLVSRGVAIGAGAPAARG